jgi:hypothetical protein
MERVTGRTLRGVDKVLGSVFKGAQQSRYLVTLCGDSTLPEGCRALKMPGHSCRAVFDLTTMTGSVLCLSYVCLIPLHKTSYAWACLIHKTLSDSCIRQAGDAR